MTSPLLGFDEMTLAQKSKYITFNEAVKTLEGSMYRVISATTTGQPASPSDGDAYILPAGATGAYWATRAQYDFVLYRGTEWVGVTPFEGFGSFWVNDEDIAITWDGSAWVNEALASVSAAGSSFTEGAVPFGESGGGQLAEDSTQLFWDDTNNRLGVGVNTPATTLHVQGGAGDDSTITVRPLAPSSGGSDAVIDLIGRGTSVYNNAEIRTIGDIADSNGADVVISTDDSAGAMTEALRVDSSQDVILNNGNCFIRPSGAGGFMSIKKGDDNNGASVRLRGSSTNKSWLIGNQVNKNGALEITPSTAAGGDTYSTPAAIIVDSGDIGVGTGNATPDARLHVGGSIKQDIVDNPTVTGQVIDAVNLNGALGVSVAGNYAYVACSVGNSLTVVDISDPSSPTVSGQVIDATNLNGAWSAHVSGNYAYVACYTGDSLTVVDISDPTAPTVSGQVIDATNLNGASSTHVSGNYAYVACNAGNSLTVVDISDPSAPSVAGQVIDAVNLNGAIGAQVSGNYAYVVSSTGDSLTVVDISDPTAPSVAGQVIDAVNLNGPYALSVAGNYAYVACSVGSSLTVVDISDPTAPTVAGQVIDAVNLATPRGVYVSGNYAYVSSITGHSLAVVDISDPTAPTVVGQVIDTTNLNGARGVHVSGNYAYVACRDGDSLTVLDINGVKLQAANIGNIKTHHIDVDQEAQVGNLLVKSGANIGGNVKVGGSMSLGDGSVPMSIYDEGTWTPYLSASVTGGTHTYSTQVGTYVRVGNLVHVSCVISISTKDATINGNLRITGLPFASKNLTGYTASSSVGTTSSFTSTNKPVAILAASTTTMNLYQYVSTGASSLLTHSHLGSTPSIHFSLTYLTE